MPEVSVVMSVWNAAPSVEGAVKSILQQTLRDFEFIIVDDGSADNTGDILRSFCDSRLRLFQNNRNLGLAASLNRGFDFATGNYIARMDADDISFPRRLERQVAFLEANHKIDVCGTWIRCHGKGYSYLLTYPTGPDCVRASMLFANPLAHPTVCMRAEPIRRMNLRYNEAFRVAQDYEFWARCAEHLLLDNVPRALLQYNVHSASTTQTRRAVSNATAGEIIRGQLSMLGIEASQQELLQQQHIGQGGVMESRQELDGAERWLLKVLAVNDERKVLSHDGLRRAIAFVWYRVCMNSAPLGIWVARKYLQSGLSQGFRPAPSEAGRFAANLLWFTLRRSLRVLG